MTTCESVRGEWGGICPDCGQRLPERPGPLSSWRGLPEREGLDLLPPRNGGRKSGFRDQAMLDAVLRHEGHRTRAAESEGVTVSFVSHALRRLAGQGNQDAITLRGAR